MARPASTSRALVFVAALVLSQLMNGAALAGPIVCSASSGGCFVGLNFQCEPLGDCISCMANSWDSNGDPSSCRCADDDTSKLMTWSGQAAGLPEELVFPITFRINLDDDTVFTLTPSGEIAGIDFGTASQTVHVSGSIGVTILGPVSNSRWTGIITDASQLSYAPITLNGHAVQISTTSVLSSILALDAAPDFSSGTVHGGADFLTHWTVDGEKIITFVESNDFRSGRLDLESGRLTDITQVGVLVPVGVPLPGTVGLVALGTFVLLVRLGRRPLGLRPTTTRLSPSWGGLKGPVRQPWPGPGGGITARVARAEGWHPRAHRPTSDSP